MSASSQHFVTRLNERRSIVLGKSGPAATKPQTVVDALKRTVSRCPDKVALVAGKKRWTWSSYYQQACQFARAAVAVGHQPKDGVSIIGTNSPFWFFAAVGTILCGGIVSGLYTTNASEVCSYIVQKSGSKVVVCEGAKQLAKFEAARAKGELGDVLAFVVWQHSEDEGTDGRSTQAYGGGGKNRVWTWDEFLALGGEEGDGHSHSHSHSHGSETAALLSQGKRELLQGQLDARMSSQLPEDCCTLVWTSGTTGSPKGTMISHDNLLFVAASVLERFSADENERMVSYLPLSHVAAFLLDIFGPLAVGFCVYFARPDALKGSLVETLKEVKPTVFVAVPRVYEKIQEKMMAVGQSNGCLVAAISRWAKGVGAAASAADERGEAMPWGFALAKTLVFDNVRRALGLQDCRILASAAAPLQPATAAYFASLNLPICEVFGMSESTGPATACLPTRGDRRTGTSGKTLPGMELAIFPPPAFPGAPFPDQEPRALAPGEEGEICLRGRHVMLGYKDDEANTAAVIDRHGWLHSGDLGRVDRDGFLTISGRIKELIITAGGENIAPVAIENAIQAELPAVSTAVVIGDKRKFLTVLIALKCKVDPVTGGPLDELDTVAKKELALNAGSSAKTFSEARDDPAVSRYIEAGIKRANKKAVSNAWMVQKFRLLPRDLSVFGGELTATMKLKRKVVSEAFAAEIESMYDDFETGGSGSSGAGVGDGPAPPLSNYSRASPPVSSKN